MLLLLLHCRCGKALSRRGGRVWAWRRHLRLQRGSRRRVKTGLGLQLRQVRLQTLEAVVKEPAVAHEDLRLFLHGGKLLLVGLHRGGQLR